MGMYSVPRSSSSVALHFWFSRDTLRPVKRLDTASSLRLSEGFVGTTRSTGSDESPTELLPPLPTSEGVLRKSSKNAKQKASAKQVGPSATAGAAIITQVVLPRLETVSGFGYQ